MKHLRGRFSALFFPLIAVQLLASGYALGQGQASQTAASPRGQSEGPGSTIFGNYCEQCHGKVEGAPTPATLKTMTPEHIYLALSQGDMVQMAKDLTDLQKRQIAEWVGGRMMGSQESGDARKMPNRCPANSSLHDLTSKGSWNGWSPGLNDARFQDGKDANMTAAKVARLKVKWAFGFPGASETYAQPTIVDGKIFVSSDAGYVYSLDAETGCVHWSFDVGAGVRSPVVVGQLKAGTAQYAAFLGDIRGNVYALDASTGQLIWKIRVDQHELSRITAGLVLYKGRLFVPVTSLEEPESSSYNYLCCTFRGMVAALDSSTGKQIWKTYTIPQPATKQVSAKGVAYMGPAGVGVWGAVSIDTKRNALYFGTGNTFAGPDVGASDAVMALDVDTGRLLWSKQDEPDDIWHTGCPQGPSPPGFAPKPARRPTQPGAGAPTRPAQAAMPATYWCADPEGPDFDIASGAMIADLRNGRNLVIAGSKSGMVWAHDPDAKGSVVWRADSARGQIVFGGALEDDLAYFNFRNGGVAALRVSDGVEQWYTPIEPSESMSTHGGFSAAVTAIPGVIFAAGLDGTVHALNAFNGNPIWQFDTAKEFQTVNGVTAHGGSIGSASVVVANGMLFVTSGFTGFQNGVPGNLLLAFSEQP
jgi:polyvinyl alcohol dehydrogenase (cytochrome)